MAEKLAAVVPHNDLCGSGYISSDPDFGKFNDGVVVAPLVFDKQKIDEPGDPRVYFGIDKIIYK